MGIEERISHLEGRVAELSATLTDRLRTVSLAEASVMSALKPKELRDRLSVIPHLVIGGKVRFRVLDLAEWMKGQRILPRGVEAWNVERGACKAEQLFREPKEAA
jgi:hypothetical protein